MKNIIILFLLTIFLSSCHLDSTIKKTKTLDQYGGQDVQIMVVDSCEYILFLDNIYSVTHKGNCKFCKIRNKK